MIRITAGIYKNRRLFIPKKSPIRPTPEMQRERLFHILHTQIVDAAVLDLFAGSGILGFEALSRGADTVLFVENHKESIRCIEQTIKTLQTSNAHLWKTDVFQALQRLQKQGKTFDCIFADPPFTTPELAQKTLLFIDENALLKKGGSFFLEHKTNSALVVDSLQHLSWVNTKKSGDSSLSLFSTK